MLESTSIAPGFSRHLRQPTIGMLVAFAPLLLIIWFFALIYGFWAPKGAQRVVQGLPGQETRDLAQEANGREHLVEQQSAHDDPDEGTSLTEREACSSQVPLGLASSSWYLSPLDARSLVQRLRSQDAGMEVGWNLMMKKETPGFFKYTAYKRIMPNGLTEYRTTTTVPEISTLEFSEFLLDDSARKNWESFSQEVSIVEQGNWLHHREQVVKWVRRFPFHFLTDREYIIANQLYTLDPNSDQLLPFSAARPGWEVYACTRGLDDHPCLPADSGRVRVTGFNSNWRCRSVPWDKGSAAEVVLLHSENIRIPETLARWAVKIGMASFVKELTDGLFAYVAARRARGIPPDALDPYGYGHNFSCQLELQQQESGDSIGRVRGIVQQINLRDGAGLSHKVRAHGPLCLPVPHLAQIQGQHGASSGEEPGAHSWSDSGGHSAAQPPAGPVDEVVPAAVSAPGFGHALDASTRTHHTIGDQGGKVARAMWGAMRSKIAQRVMVMLLILTARSVIKRAKRVGKRSQDQGRKTSSEAGSEGEDAAMRVHAIH